MADIEEKIGNTKHPRRNTMIGAGLVLAVAGIGGFYWWTARAEAPMLRTLADFRSAYATKCNVAAFEGPTPPYIADEYLNSPLLQEVVAKQQASLNETSCGDIDRALRAASFPLSAKRAL